MKYMIFLRCFCESLVISPANQLNECDLMYVNHDSFICMASEKPIKDIFNIAYKFLSEEHKDTEILWNMNKAKSWGKEPASINQIKFIKRLLRNPNNAEKYKSTALDYDSLNKHQANIVINKLLYSN